jgi:hypothetical protein
LLVCLAPSLMMAACRKGVVVGNGGVEGHTLRATIDGRPWVADADTIHVGAGGMPSSSLSFMGADVVATENQISMAFNLGYIDGPKTYPLGVNSATNAGGTVTVTDPPSTNGGGFWWTDLNGASGSLTVTGMSSSWFEGTFQFVAPEYLDTTTIMHTVTDGRFELPVPAEFQTPTADDYGSTMTATVNGQAWNGATVTGLGNPASGALSFSGMSTALSINFTALTPLSVGTFDQTGVRITATGANGSTGSVSSVNVTTLTATRIVGTFSATLPTMSGTASSLTITAGTFDVRIDSSP